MSWPSSWRRNSRSRSRPRRGPAPSCFARRGPGHRSGAGDRTESTVLLCLQGQARLRAAHRNAGESCCGTGGVDRQSGFANAAMISSAPDIGSADKKRCNPAACAAAADQVSIRPAAGPSASPANDLHCRGEPVGAGPWAAGTAAVRTRQYRFPGTSGNALRSGNRFSGRSGRFLRSRGTVPGRQRCRKPVRWSAPRHRSIES